MSDQPPYDQPEQGGAAVSGDPTTQGWSDRGGGPPAPRSGWADEGREDWRQLPPDNGKGVAALVVGIIAALASIPIFPLGILLGIVAVVLGVLGRKKAARREATNGGQATAGMVLGIVAIVVGALVGVLLGSLIATNSEEISDLADCLSDAGSTAEQDECRQRFESEVGAG